MSPSSSSILIVDDHPSSLRLLRDLLAEKGYHTRSVTNGAMALTSVQAGHPDLILLDIDMPDISGFEVCRQLKADEATREIPVIFLSAATEASDKVRAFEVGGEDYVTKPFQVEEVLTRVKHHLALSRLRQQLQHMNQTLEQQVEDRTRELHETNARLRESKEVLSKAEAKFRGLMESALDGMILVNEAGEMMHVNVQAERLFGYKEEELTGQPCEMLIPERFSLHDRLRDAYLADPKQRPMGIGLELFGLRKDGREFPVEISLTPLHTEEGLIVSCVIRDVTERKQAEELLTFQASLLEQVHNGVITIDFDNRITYWNPYAETLYQWKSEDVLGKNIVDLLSPEQLKETALRNIEKLTNEGHWEGEFNVRRKDGSTISAHIINVGLKNANGEPIGFIGISTDITERKQAEEERARLFEEIIAANNRLEQMSYRLVALQEEERRRLARELHDEVGGLLSSLHLAIKMTPASEEAARQHTQMASQLVDSLIEQIRTLSLRLRPHVLDDLGLVPALRWLLKQYRKQTRIEVVFQHEISDDTRFSPELEITAYRIIQEALTNVARHAEVDAVQVLLLREGDRLVIHVIDEGQGFEVEIARARQDSMGLSGMEERSALLGGTLTLDTAPGIGTKVTATLPLD